MRRYLDGDGLSMMSLIVINLWAIPLPFPVPLEYGHFVGQIVLDEEWMETNRLCKQIAPFLVWIFAIGKGGREMEGERDGGRLLQFTFLDND